MDSDIIRCHEGDIIVRGMRNKKPHLVYLAAITVESMGEENAIAMGRKMANWQNPLGTLINEEINDVQ